MSEPTEQVPHEPLLPEVEIRRRHAEDQDARLRAEEVMRRVDQGDPAGQLIEAEDLADFLREQE